MNSTIYKTFNITVTPNVPTWQLSEYSVEICAKSRADAIREARKQYKENWLDWGHGAATYRAKEILEPIYS